MADSVIDCSPMSEVSTASTTAHTEENHVDESPRGIAVMVVVGVLVGQVVGLNPFLALQCSSASMSGGVGTASAFGRHFDVGDCAHLGVRRSGLCG